MICLDKRGISALKPGNKLIVNAASIGCKAEGFLTFKAISDAVSGIVHGLKAADLNAAEG